MAYIDKGTQNMYSNELSIEIAVLQEDVQLPSISLEPLTNELLKEHHSNITDEEGKIIKYADPYFMPYQVCTNVIGNFFIPMMFPLVENGKSEEKEVEPPKTGGVTGEGVNAEKYITRNFISLIIPKYIAMNFYKYPDYTNFPNTGDYYSGEYKQMIPKGTKFLCTFIGGSTNINNISIIGLVGDQINVTDTILTL